MRISLSIETLQAAYDVCLQVKCFTGNVIASGDYAQSDIENYNKSKKFMQAYDRAFKDKPERKQERGKWIKNLEYAMNKLSDSVENLPKDIDSTNP